MCQGEYLVHLLSIYLNTRVCAKDPCENVECPQHQECLASFDGASARCACRGPCTDTADPALVVCGSDGRDYASMCHLGMASAAAREFRIILDH